jgi:superfamily II DNA/RNA helicase
MTNATEMKPGKLVKVRHREWIVQPSNDLELLRIKPLGGSEDEITAIYLPIGFENEQVEEVFFPKPDVDDLGDLQSAQLLYDAIRLSFRDASGPFRSVAKYNFQPRAYQMVPLIMALRQDDPVRLFIADDVGIGKTVEALMIARELMDRGVIKRFVVVCLPHLCEQWQEEMQQKFGIEAVIIRSSTAASLDRKTPGDVSAFAYYPFQIVSIDYVKSDRRVDSFVEDCPELVIVDEAHTCSVGDSGNRQQRNHLLKRISAKPDQHLLMLSATPHSGKSHEFQSLLALIDPEFTDLDLSEATPRKTREKLAQHYVQRRRADIIKWDGDKYQETTHFPERENFEVEYGLSPDYLQLQYDVMQLARQIAGKDEEKKNRKRLNYWTALSLLRGVMSSPAAGIQMLENRARKQLSEEELDQLGDGQNPVLEDDYGFEGDEATLLLDPSFVPAAAPDSLSPGPSPGERGDVADVIGIGGVTGAGASSGEKLLHELSHKLLAIQQQGEDFKVTTLVKLVKQYQKDGFNPIVYCRYIATAEYVGRELRKGLPKKVGVGVVTSRLPDEARHETIGKLGDSDVRVLVATDCMSEGINLQRHFTAVIHYDLPWNPNRLEQREGRVDRFGQIAPEVRTALLYGKDNPMDGIVLKVLLRKARAIKKAIGISVPFPESNESIMDAVTQAVLLRTDALPAANQLGLFDNLAEVNEQADKVDLAYKKLEDRETATRSIFAQHAVKAQDIDQDLDEAIRLIGDMASVEKFTLRAIRHLGGNWSKHKEGYRIEKAGLPFSLTHLFTDKYLDVSFATPTPEGFRFVARNHPLVDGLAQLLMAESLDKKPKFPVARACVLRTKTVERMTTVLLLRVRNVIESQATKNQIVAEELLLKAYRGAPGSEEWLSEEEAMALLQSDATAEVATVEKEDIVLDALEDLKELQPTLDGFGRKQAEKLIEAHERFRQAVQGKRFQVVEPILPMDVMGVYVFLPDRT